jgi:hypothetical protein
MEDGEKEIFKISRCPLCFEEHSYNLKITRSWIIGLILFRGGSGRKEQPRKKRVVHLFTCPTKNQDFQATLLLEEWPNAPIESIDIEK